MLFILFAVVRNGMLSAVAILLLIGVPMLIARVQPYKAEFAAYNAIDSSCCHLSGKLSVERS